MCLETVSVMSRLTFKTHITNFFCSLSVPGSEHASLGRTRGWTTTWRRGRGCTWRTWISVNTSWRSQIRRTSRGFPGTGSSGWLLLSCCPGLCGSCQSIAQRMSTTMWRSCSGRTRMAAAEEGAEEGQVAERMGSKAGLRMESTREELGLELVWMGRVTEPSRGSTRWTWQNWSGTFAVTNRWCPATLKPSLWTWTQVGGRTPRPLRPSLGPRAPPRATGPTRLLWLCLWCSTRLTSSRAVPDAGEPHQVPVFPPG